MEGQFGFHGKPPSAEQAEEALDELEEKLAEQPVHWGLAR